jgi:hypothetical protein
MWIWKQAAGELWRALDGDPVKVSDGYSGHGHGRNNPAMQAVHDFGPIPQGTYSIGAMRDTEAHGPCVLPLSQVAGESFGRAGFLIHGDSHTGDASKGCIILPRTVRLAIAQSDDRLLRVVA